MKGGSDHQTVSSGMFSNSRDRSTSRQHVSDVGPCRLRTTVFSPVQLSASGLQLWNRS